MSLKNKFKRFFHKMKGSFHAKWGKISNDEIEHTKGNYHEIVDQLCQKYGYTQEEAEKELRVWQSSGSKDCNCQDVNVSKDGISCAKNCSGKKSKNEGSKSTRNVTQNSTSNATSELGKSSNQGQASKSKDKVKLKSEKLYSTEQSSADNSAPKKAGEKKRESKEPKRKAG